MKKRGIALTLALVLALALGACGKKEAPFPADTAQRLVEAQGVFSEGLESVETPVLLRLYGLEEGEVQSAAGFGSTGATAEEVALFTFATAAEAKEAMEKMDDHLVYVKESNESYRPQEMPKLEKAEIIQRENTILFLVAADYQAAKDILG